MTTPENKQSLLKNYAGAGIDKKFLTPCRRVGLSKTRRTPKNNILQSSPVLNANSVINNEIAVEKSCANNIISPLNEAKPLDVNQVGVNVLKQFASCINQVKNTNVGASNKTSTPYRLGLSRSRKPNQNKNLVPLTPENKGENLQVNKLPELNTSVVENKTCKVDLIPCKKSNSSDKPKNDKVHRSSVKNSKNSINHEDSKIKEEFVEKKILLEVCHYASTKENEIVKEVSKESKKNTSSSQMQDKSGCKQDSDSNVEYKRSRINSDSHRTSKNRKRKLQFDTSDSDEDFEDVKSNRIVRKLKSSNKSKENIKNNVQERNLEKSTTVLENLDKNFDSGDDVEQVKGRKTVMKLKSSEELIENIKNNVEEKKGKKSAIVLGTSKSNLDSLEVNKNVDLNQKTNTNDSISQIQDKNVCRQYPDSNVENNRSKINSDTHKTTNNRKRRLQFDTSDSEEDFEEVKSNRTDRKLKSSDKSMANLKNNAQVKNLKKSTTVCNVEPDKYNKVVMKLESSEESIENTGNNVQEKELETSKCNLESSGVSKDINLPQKTNTDNSSTQNKKNPKKDCFIISSDSEPEDSTPIEVKADVHRSSEEVIHCKHPSEPITHTRNPITFITGSLDHSASASSNSSVRLGKFTTEDYLKEFSRNPQAFYENEGIDLDDFDLSSLVKVNNDVSEHSPKKLSENLKISNKSLSKQSIKVSNDNKMKEVSINLERMPNNKSNSDKQSSRQRILSRICQEDDDDDFTCSPRMEQQQKEDLLKLIMIKEKEIRDKEALLASMKQTQVYKKKHNAEKIKIDSNVWLNGCQSALKDLLCRLREHGPMEMELLVKNLMIPPHIVDKLSLVE
ncbi:dentin sialophosphoprotein-like [Sitophilus oryzae]|uniref:Dentin sialophosphoprotein-like n=1 Tax=Sitophilus oryzae TaxID=7048 RepID=A0A6J2YY98_SITOR|nr:dentin sialophosphoprotein-like [Sitophilus oryzae]